MTTTPDLPGARPVLTFRTNEDVLAAVPVLLGFEPTDSLVMLTFGGRETFHARIDLPRSQREVGDAVALLLSPALLHGVEQVLFVAYAATPRMADRLLERLGSEFADAGIGLVRSLRADGTCWHLDGGPGVPYDVGTHEFRVRSVVDGQVVSRSRAELAALLDPTPGVAAVGAARARVSAFDATEVAAHVWSAVERGRFADDELAGVLQGLRDLSARDAAWSAMTRETAPAHVRLWTDAVQRAPDDLVAAPAAVLALAAWLAGNGALAWCAVDRCVARDPDCSLARLVGDLLDRAVAPSSWDRSWPGCDRAG